MSDDNARTTRLILVHGTWGRGFCQRTVEPKVIVSEEIATTGAAEDKWCARVRWFEPGSEFRERLADSLHQQEIRFTTRILVWDGHNSIVSRDKAAVALADAIGKLAEAAPHDPIVIIAHSHGGNVALRAVHLADAKSMANLRVVTLATPFVQIYAQSNSGVKKVGYFLSTKKEAHPFMRNSLMVVAALPFLLALAIPTFKYEDALRALLQPVIFVDPVVVAVACEMLFALFVGSKLSKLVMTSVANPEPGPSAEIDPDDHHIKSRRAGKPERLASLSTYGPLQSAGDRLLVLRGIDDEASLTLAAGSIGNRVAHFLLGTALPFVQEKLAALAVVAMCASIVKSAVGSSFAQWLSDLLLLVIIFGFAGTAVLAVAVFVLPGVFRSVFGRELLFGSWRCEIAANSSPDSGNGVQVETLLMQPELVAQRLRHALYMNPEVPRRIGAWLRTSADTDRTARAPK